MFSHCRVCVCVYGGGVALESKELELSVQDRREHKSHVISDPAEVYEANPLSGE